MVRGHPRGHPPCIAVLSGPFQVSTQALHPRGSAGDPRLPLPGPGPLPFLWELSPSLQMPSRAPQRASSVRFWLGCRSAHSSCRPVLPPARRWPPSTPLRPSPLSFVSRKRHRPEHRPARNPGRELRAAASRSRSRDEAAAAAPFLFVANVTHTAEVAGRSLQVRDFRAASGTGC